MNRLVRISVTLFASATVLALLVSQRLKQLKIDIDGGLAEEAAQSEGRMIAMGVVIAGVLASVGFVLIILSIARSRRKLPPIDE